jgi:hypothetical protein
MPFTAETHELVYCIVDLEFGEEHQGKEVLIQKALYVFGKTSIASWYKSSHTQYTQSKLLFV